MDTRSLTKVLESQVYEADVSGADVGYQRERGHRMYSLQPLGNEIRGRSQYISPDVLDTVEAKKAFYRETFFSGRRTCKFTPGDYESAQDAEAKTAYVERQLAAQPGGWYRLARDGWHDAMVAKRCVYHVEWLEDEEITTLDISGATPQHIQWQLAQMPDLLDVDESGVVFGPDGLLYGRISMFTDTSRVNIRLIQPERYYRDPHATYPDEAVYCVFEDDETRAELINQGYDPEQVEKLRGDGNRRGRGNEEDSSRKAHDGSWTRHKMYSRPDEQEMLTTYWSYTWLDMSEHLDGAKDGTRLYKVRWCDGEVLRFDDGALDISEVPEMPFFEWAQLKISHAENGMCDADIVAHTQRTQSALKRLIVDNQQMRNTSRVEARQGAIKNPRDLLDPKIGGVIWSQDGRSVTPLAAPDLSPLTMAAIEMLEQDKEARTGSSRLAKGMNQQAVSQQNADSMIERLTNASNRRIMGECRDYAETLLVPLMKHIYRLGVRHDKRAYLLSVSGQQVQVAPQQWQDVEPLCKVQVALTPDEGAQHAQQLMAIAMQWAQSPVMGQLFGVQQQHALWGDVLDCLGLGDTSRYLMQPGGPEHMQVMQEQQMAMMQQQQQMAQQAAMQMQLMQSADQREWQKVRVDEARRIHIDGLNIAEDNRRADEELAHQRVYDFAKLGQERQRNAA